jgi:hypothetical protein
MRIEKQRASYALTILGILIFSGSSLFAQQAVSPDVAALLKRIDQLEQRVKTLEADKTPSNDATVSSSSTAMSAMASSSKPSTSSDSMAGMGGMSMPTPEHHFGNMNVQGFADVGWVGNDQSHSTNSFYLGQMNLFITSKLSETSSIIAETVFESDDRNAYGVELERLLYNWSPNDSFNISVGRFHSAIGYYNTAYHHSTWMQTAMNRPQLFAFEDDGGILPIHNVGVSVTGLVPSGSLGLHYIAELGNGRTSRSLLKEPVQNVLDENNRKSTNFGFYVRPQRFRGFQAGFSWYNDRLMPDGLPRIGESIYSVHAVYNTPKLEFLNEAVLVRHTPDGVRSYNTPGWYSQISPQLKYVRPYFRYQYVNASVNEPVYSDVGLMHGPSVGLRFNMSEFAAFKIQYDRGMYRTQSPTNGLGAQMSFAF